MTEYLKRTVHDKVEAATTQIQAALIEARHEHGAEAVVRQLEQAQRALDTLSLMADEPVSLPAAYPVPEAAGNMFRLQDQAPYTGLCTACGAMWPPAGRMTCADCSPLPPYQPRPSTEAERQRWEDTVHVIAAVPMVLRYEIDAPTPEET